MARRRKSYVPDLKVLAGICENNYLMLLKLLPEQKAGDSRDFNISNDQQQTVIRLTISEQFKYTTTIEVEQLSSLHNYLSPPKMLVRLYHDVRMAEVVSFDNQHRFNGVYHYPNEQMRQPDEKHQINHFLSDWLHHCLEHGGANMELNFYPFFTETP